MLCVLISLCLSTTAEAANPLLRPIMLQRDLPVIIQELELDKEQGAVLDHVLSEYIAADEAARGNASEALLSIDPDSLHLDWHPRDWSSHQASWAETRAQASAMDDPIEAAAWLRYREAQAREEFADAFENRPPPLPSERARTLEHWRAVRAQLRQDLQRDIDLIVSPAQAARWDRVESAIRRQRSPFTGEITGEDLDLGMLIRRIFQNDPGVIESMRDDLAAYEHAWATVAKVRDDVLADLYARRLDAKERRDEIDLLAITQEEVVARKRLRDVNLEWFQRLGGQLPVAFLNDFQRDVSEAMHPDIFRSSQAARVSEWLLGQGDVPEEMRAAAIALRVRFGGPRLRAAANERAAERAAAGRVLTARAEQRAMAQVFGPTALFGLADTPEDEALVEALKMAERRRQLDVSWLGNLRDLLGPERWNAVPSETRLPPKVLRGTLQDDSGEPLRFAPIQ
ncbi:MAG: hypothetical protein GY894_01435 [Planctomycetes bacterium]|nr:hypothetical protein [Planctomycetota bacterium]MCP4838012.1 hypothetical protein [Planctomycetota bacterium]